MKTLDSMILREMGTLARSVHSICNTKFKELKLQAGQFIYLTRVCENPGLSLADLTLLLKVDKTSTTKAVQKLEAEGYIQRKQDKKDRRILRLYPTEKGLRSYDEILELENQHISTCLEGFSPEEVNAVTEFIKRMSQNMGAEWGKKSYLGGSEND